MPKKRAAVAAMRQRMRLEAPADTADDIGGGSRVYALVANVWGEISPLGGDEQFVSDRFNARVTHRVTLRHRIGVTARMRLAAGVKTLAIRAVFDPEGKRQRLICLVEELSQ